MVAKLKLLGVIAALLIVALSLPAQGPKLPSPIIVAKTSFLNQTGTIPQTNIYTATADGDFRFSAYLDSAASTGSGALVITWTDDFSTTAAAQLNFGPTSAPTHAGLTAPIRMKAGTSFALFENNPGPLGPYNVYITLESLP
jgi:hypothetical protein